MPVWNRAASATWWLLIFTVLAQCCVAQNGPVAISVDVNASRHAISPLIYGISWGYSDLLKDLNCPLNRYGGNNASRYNWLQNADNRGRDWYFQSVPDTSATPGERGDSFISAGKTAGAESMLTIPTIGWVAKLGPGRGKLSSFSIAKYGQQTDRDWSYFPDAGNGVLQSTGQFVTGNNPNDANIPSDSAFQLGWVNHLIQTWGLASAGGLKYYVLDNEPSIWQSTHRDVHPAGATMAEIRDRMADYAGRIRAADPTAVIVGPEEWGWSGYLYSGFDQQWGNTNGWNYLPDRAANGNWDYLPWILDQMRQKSAAAGARLLDVFSVHYYPQGGEFSNDTSVGMQLRRNRSTRSLWDPNYVDESWIGTGVHLVPRLKTWVDSYYPGTKTGITEYNWGAEEHINGATAQADIFGIFGREGLDLAARWVYPDPSTPTYKAMKLYRNYDGQKSTFGDVSVSASVPAPDNLSCFAAERTSDGALTVMVISKYLSGSTPITINVANYPQVAPVRVWQLTASNTITKLADTTVAAGILAATVPAQSITLFVIDGKSTNNTSYRVNCSGSAVGGFAADAFFSGGQLFSTSATIDTSGATNPAPMAVYQTVRWEASQFSYTFPGLSPGGSCLVRLHFVEPVNQTAGVRPMNVSINGSQVLTNFDPFTAAGGYNRAVVREFTVAADSAGKVSMTFVRTGADTACVAGIEVVPTTPTAPSAPTGFTATSGNTQITLNWTAVSNAASYNLYRSTSAGGEGATPYKTGITAASYTDTGLTNGTTYFYQVTAVNSVGESPRSVEASATPTSANSTSYKINCSGGAVGNFAADAFFSGGQLFSTSATIDTSGATNPAPMAVYQTVRWDASQLSYSFPNLTAGGAYLVRLHFVEPVNQTAGVRPMNVSINGSQVLTNFDPFTAAGGYNRAVVKDFTVTADSAGKMNITFVRAGSDTACVAGIEVLVSTPAAPSTPTGFTAMAGNTQIALSWSSVSNAASYNLYRSLTSGGEGATPYKTGITASSYTDTGLTNGTTYFYQVTAVNSVGESPRSVEASATPTSANSTSYKINCSGGAVGNFAADAFFSGGQLFSTSATIDTSGATNPVPMAVYQTVRWDASQLSYSFPNLTAASAYLVRLHFVEPVNQTAGVRPMNVSINGSQVLTNFDPFTAAGGYNRAVVREFTVAADSAGKVSMTFVRTGADTACVAGIEVLAQ